MPSLGVPGADLHYETFGSGPLLLLITGAEGRGSVWHPIVQDLATQYTVVCWDRRGYSGSVINGPQNYSERLSTDADDAAHLIKHLSPDRQATVIGNSSGAIVSQELLLRHPDCVLKVVSHEPPAFGALPPQFRSKGEEVINHIYNQYRTKGSIAAMDEFTGGLQVGDEGALMRKQMHPGHSHEIRANSMFWFEFELRQYPCTDLDVGALVAVKDKFIPAAGVDSGDNVGVAPIAAIASAMGKKILRLPGGHIGYTTHPKQWVAAVLEGVKKY